MVLWKGISSILIGASNVVSILVLLDGALEVVPCLVFNSYFGLFQSLFCWMVLWKPLQLVIVYISEQYIVVVTLLLACFNMSKNGYLLLLLLVSECVYCCNIVDYAQFKP